MLYIGYANNRSPSRLMLKAAFQSLFTIKPHSQRNVRSERDKDSFFRPQQEQVLEEGNHLSILISFFPCSSNLYWRNVVNIPMHDQQYFYRNLGLVTFPSY